MIKGVKRTYRKHINLRYEYVDCPDGKEALADVFDDIFMRIIQKKSIHVSANGSKTLTNTYNDL
jgi:hypothetical protein